VGFVQVQVQAHARNQPHCVPHGWSVSRAVEDYGVVYLGSAIFKVARLTFIALFFVHLFACLFYRIKDATAESPEDVVDFYNSKNVDTEVSLAFWRISNDALAAICLVSYPAHKILSNIHSLVLLML
jgi:hypothetical protein